MGHATKEMPGIDGGQFENKHGSVVDGDTLGKLLEEETSGAITTLSSSLSRVKSNKKWYSKYYHHLIILYYEADTYTLLLHNFKSICNMHVKKN